MLLSILLGIGAPIVIRMLGGPEFDAAAPLLSIQAIGLAASFVGAVWSYGLLSLGRTRDILKINVAALVLGGALWLSWSSATGPRERRWGRREARWHLHCSVPWP